MMNQQPGLKRVRSTGCQLNQLRCLLLLLPIFSPILISGVGFVEARSPPFVLPSDSESINLSVGGQRRQVVPSDSITQSTILESPSASRMRSTGGSATKNHKNNANRRRNHTLSSSTTSTRGGASTTATNTQPTTTVNANNNVNRSPTTNLKSTIRVAYQGEPGAYSEKSLRELLGPNVIAVPRPNFEACYRAVASRECDYALLPVENSLGGSIHENYDLMLRYDLTIVAEHEYRVSHCLHAINGVKREEIKYCMSHPQALAQCDNYLRGLGITPVPMYDTAGSAKLLADHYRASKSSKAAEPERALPDECTAKNTAAIASDLAGLRYKLNTLDTEIEDDDTNFTRFLLLGRNGVAQHLHLNKNIPSKTSVVFTLPNTPGALFKALACFSLREIDFSKIESRPTSASLLNYLKFKNQQAAYQRGGSTSSSVKKIDLPRFKYCFYLDFLESELNDNAQNALHHLREQAEFCRVLGSYPQKSRLVGAVHDQVEESKQYTVQDPDDVTLLKLPSDVKEDMEVPLNVGIIGYGQFGQFLGAKFAEKHRVRCIDTLDKSVEAEEAGVEYYPMFEMNKFLKDSDILILAVPILDFESTVSSLPMELLHGKLLVDVCPLSVHPKSVLLQYTKPDMDILCSNPMFGAQSYLGSSSSSSPSSSAASWEGQPMIYEKVRIRDDLRADRFLRVFEEARCQMVQMTAEQQDAHTADAEFVTHLTGRLLDGGKMLPLTPVPSKEYAALRDVADLTHGDTFDMFYGMFKFNENAKEHLSKMRDNLAKIERQLAAKEAYLTARAEMRNTDRRRLIAECKELLRDVAAQNLSTLQQQSAQSDTAASDKSTSASKGKKTISNGGKKK